MKNYPANDGWLKAKLSIIPGTELSQNDVLKFITCDDPTKYEVAEFKHFKTVIRIVLRKKTQDEKI